MEGNKQPANKEGDNKKRTPRKGALVAAEAKRMARSRNEQEDVSTCCLVYQGYDPNRSRFSKFVSFDPPQGEDKAEEWLRQLNEIKEDFDNLLAKCEKFVDDWKEKKVPTDLRQAIGSLREHTWGMSRGYHVHVE